MPYTSLRHRRALALAGVLAACDPTSGDGANAPHGQVRETPTSCADGGTCAAGAGSGGDPTITTTGGDGTPVFGADMTNAGGVPLSDKIDLLFVLDNSASMGDKQQIFSAAIPDLLERLVNPPCLNAGLTDAVQPATASDACPAGFARQFAPLKDIHVGIVTSSLGSHGADNPIAGCSEAENDGAHLMGTLERGRVVPSYRDLGFLSWDPEQRVQPPGDTDLEQIKQGFVNLVGTVGETGCGFEAPLEAMYRFLMDPAPHAELERVACNDSDQNANCRRPTGIDQALLEQRAAFLRPDSVVAIVMLADEDDCSIRDTDIAWWQADSSRGITRASQACDADPNSACCYSCSFETPAACPPKSEDSGCCPPGAGGAACRVEPLMTPEEESRRFGQNLRCFDQKRKYGYDYLYPIERYVLGLTSAWLPEGFDEQGRPLADPDGQVRFLKNPLYSQPIDSEDHVRSRRQVFFVGIVGVPWQDVATDETRDVPGQLDLMAASTFGQRRLWERILGSSVTSSLPEDPFTIESTQPRSGENPLTKDAITPPDSQEMNAINGKERAVFDDLQYACIFPLPVSRSCAEGSANAGVACDCGEESFDGNPLCWDAATETYGTEQRFAKAYPAPRILRVLQGVGEQAVVASICPKNMTDTAARDFGYRPVIGTFVTQAARILIK